MSKPICETCALYKRLPSSFNWPGYCGFLVTHPHQNIIPHVKYETDSCDNYKKLNA